jgi:hypothetical protein
VRRAWLVPLLAAASCSLPPETITLRVELPLELANEGKQLQVLPRIAEASRKVTRGVVVLQLKRAPLVLELPGACPKRLDTRQLPGTGELRLDSLYDVGPSERIAGLGERFTIRAQPQCAEAKASRISLSHSGGAELDQLEISDAGRTLSATTKKTPPTATPQPGIVPISAAGQRRLRSELTLRLTLPDGKVRSRTLGVASVARSTGLPNVGLSHPLLIAGTGWQLLAKPPESRAELRDVAQLFELRPDVSGRYRLQDAAGAVLSIQSGRYDQMPLDCGRADCHAAIAKSALGSPMTRTLESDLGGCHALDNPSCASACHATGEPGVADGGFEQVALALGAHALPEEYEDLPAPLRRLGGVGCMACHGPAAIPEPSARWAILRSDVCAVCHDAAPRYGHFQAFRTSRMAAADHDERARGDAACARCHTSWGAIGRAAPPHELGGLGLTCATCHAVHPTKPQLPTEPGLLREFAMPSTLPSPPPSFNGPSRVCVSCHAPSSNDGAPDASAAALIAGQGGVDPRTGKPLTLAAVHAGGTRGCLSCHDSGPEELQLGKSHAFRSSSENCARCHDSPKARDPSLRTRALALLARLSPERLPSGGPAWHAQRYGALGSLERQRALFDVLLVLEDPAADVHHPAYAKLLLSMAEREAGGATP